jgi:hypothetical protein
MRVFIKQYPQQWEAVGTGPPPPTEELPERARRSAVLLAGRDAQLDGRVADVDDLVVPPDSRAALRFHEALPVVDLQEAGGVDAHDVRAGGVTGVHAVGLQLADGHAGVPVGARVVPESLVRVGELGRRCHRVPARRAYLERVLDTHVELERRRVHTVNLGILDVDQGLPVPAEVRLRDRLLAVVGVQLVVRLGRVLREARGRSATRWCRPRPDRRGLVRPRRWPLRAATL